ncbi:hypothetical protein DFH09DRAFT_1319365 [Mycena vulgaris]|nr:hypothetical protein DFH09DRAFT_1319365 [Mycena vulgaris]
MLLLHQNVAGVNLMAMTSRGGKQMSRCALRAADMRRACAPWRTTRRRRRGIYEIRLLASSRFRPPYIHLTKCLCPAYGIEYFLAFDLGCATALTYSPRDISRGTCLLRRPTARSRGVHVLVAPRSLLHRPVSERRFALPDCPYLPTSANDPPSPTAPVSPPFAPRRDIDDVATVRSTYSAMFSSRVSYSARASSVGPVRALIRSRHAYAGIPVPLGGIFAAGKYRLWARPLGASA